MAEKTTCPACKSEVAIKNDGGLYKHPCDERRERVERAERDAIAAAREVLSDPAPTVDETTTQGDDVNPDAEAQLDTADMMLTDPDRRVGNGPWFGATETDRCSVSECRIEEGDRIRADGQGGYECEGCGNDEFPTVDQVEEKLTALLSGPKSPALTFPTADEFLFEDPTATEDVKPVMSVSGQPKRVRRDHQDRYAVVLPGAAELERYRSSGKPVGRTRVTTFVKAASSTIKLGEWKARNVVIGAARRRDLLLKAQGLTHENDRDRLDAIVKELEETAGSKVGSDLGTYLHEFTEYMDAGLKAPLDAPVEFQRSLQGYSYALAQAGLEPIRSLIERTTIIREYGWVCGTFDRIFYHRPSGQYVIGDLKTGKTMDYGKNEIEAQLWAYAHGVNQNGIYDWNTDTWGQVDVPWGESAVLRNVKVSETVGVIIHMPVQGPKEGTVELLWADLENGRQHAELCHLVRSQPKGKMRAWGDGPAPVAAPTPAVKPPVPQVIDWELVDTADLPWPDRFARVTSPEQASTLWRMAKRAGLEGVVLSTLVGIAQQRLRELGVRG
jgi:hypothetical protein